MSIALILNILKTSACACALQNGYSKKMVNVQENALSGVLLQ